MNRHWNNPSRAPRPPEFPTQRALVQAVLLLALITPSTTAGQTVDLRVEAAPDSLSLGPDGAATATLIVRNGPGGPVRRVRLRATSDPELSTEIENPAVSELDASAAFVTTIRVVGRAPVQTPRRVQIFAEFERRAGATDRDALAVALTTLRVAPGPYERADQIAEIQLSSSLSTLADTDTGVVYLVIKNKADSELRVDSVLAASPSFLEVKSGGRVKIPPFSTGYVPIRVHAKDKWVRSGKHLLIFDIPLSWTTASGARFGRAVHSREVELSVLGESEILKAVAVPSFLLLPGALMVLSFGLLWRYAASWRGSKEKSDFQIGVTTHGFWVLAITLSVVMAFVYPWLGGRNYLQGYGVGDVAKIWLISVLVGALTYSIASGVMSTLIWRRTVRVTPGPKDTQLQVLRKLALQRESLVRPVVSFSSGGSTRRALLLQPANGGAGRVVVGPLIVVTWSDRATVEEKLELDRLLNSDDPKRVADFLEPRHDSNLKLQWRPAEAGSVERPTPVDTQDTSGTQRVRLVEVDEA